MNISDLKAKVAVDKEFINDLIAKGWQEIENLKNQIAILDHSSEDAVKVRQLLKNLLTSYYVFIGNLEGIESNECAETQVSDSLPGTKSKQELSFDKPEELFVTTQSQEPKTDFEPFEYFVDFDEPTGQPLTDQDLYNN
jgi:hypothetical protein